MWCWRWTSTITKKKLQLHIKISCDYTSGISRRGDRMINRFQYFHIPTTWLKVSSPSSQVIAAANILDKNTAKKTHNQFTACDVQRNNNQFRWKPYQLACIGRRLSSTHDSKWKISHSSASLTPAPRRTEAARFYSPRSSLMRSQENLLVNINLFSPSQNPNDLLKYRAQPFSFFQLPRKNQKGRLLCDYTSWENHCDHVDIAGAVLVSLISAFACVCVARCSLWERMITIAWLREKQKERMGDLIKETRIVFVIFLCNTILYGVPSNLLTFRAILGNF